MFFLFLPSCLAIWQNAKMGRRQKKFHLHEGRKKKKQNWENVMKEGEGHLRKRGALIFYGPYAAALSGVRHRERDHTGALVAHVWRRRRRRQTPEKIGRRTRRRGTIFSIYALLLLKLREDEREEVPLSIAS